MFVVVATGDTGYKTGGRYEKQNHLDPYLRTVFRFIGVTDVTFPHVGNDEFGGSRLARSIGDARRRIREAVTAARAPNRAGGMRDFFPRPGQAVPVSRDLEHLPGNAR